MKESSSTLLAAFFLAVITVMFSFSIGIFVNQYTINSYVFPLFEVDRVLGYWQTFFFTSAWNLLIFSNYTAYQEKFDTYLEKVASAFITILCVYALQYAFTWAGIQITF